MEVAATLRNASISAQKARLVVDQIRRLPVDKALNILKFSQKKAGTLVRKLLESAIHNAENNQGMDIDNLLISTAFVDQGPSSKRTHPRAKGRGNRILKRTCHITLKVKEHEE